MSQQLIGVGTVANDGTGDPLRTAFQKVNANDTELYANKPAVVASGTRWYIPTANVALATGTAVGTGSIRLFPAFVPNQITISNLAARVSTLSVGGNFQMAIYAASATTQMPTGNALVSTASIATDTTGTKTAAASLQLGPGLYWFATNADNATVAFSGIASSSLNYTQLVGSTNSGNPLAGSVIGISTPQTFGTWPSLTAASFTEVTGASIPLIMYQVDSVP